MIIILTYVQIMMGTPVMIVLLDHIIHLMMVGIMMEMDYVMLAIMMMIMIILLIIKMMMIIMNLFAQIPIMIPAMIVHQGSIILIIMD